MIPFKNQELIQEPRPSDDGVKTKNDSIKTLKVASIRIDIFLLFLCNAFLLSYWLEKQELLNSNENIFIANYFYDRI